MAMKETTETIKPLATEFREGGFDYRQLKRQNNAATFEQSKCGTVVGYEVVLIRVRPGRTYPNGKSTGPYECYPSSDDWGKWGWTCSTLARAEERFQGLLRTSE